MHPIQTVNQQLKQAALWSFISAAFMAVMLYIVGLIPLWLIFDNKGFIISAGLVILLTVIGMKYKEEVSVDGFLSPFDAESASGFHANRAVNRLSGPAYVISHLILGTSTRIKRGIRLKELQWDATEQEMINASKILQRLQSLGTSPRFHDISHFKDDSEMVEKLSSLGIIWEKVDKGRILVGLNRTYDDYKFS